MTSSAPWYPCTQVEIDAHPKLTTKSGMAKGITSSTAQMRRPGRSVHSTSQAVRVPITAQSAVTTTVSRTVFQSRAAVSGRQMSWAMVPTPEPLASMRRKRRGASSTTATAPLAPSRRSGGRRRRAGTMGLATAGRSATTAFAVTGGSVRDLSPEPATGPAGPPHGPPAPSRGRPATGPAGSQQARLLHQRDRLRPVAQLGDGDGVGLELPKRCLLLGGRDPRVDRVLVAGGAGDDLLALLRDEEGEEPLGRGLVGARPQDGGAGDVEDVPRVMRG